MNRLSTAEVRRSQRNSFSLFACLILACALVFCQAVDNTSWDKRPDATRSGDVLSTHSEVPLSKDQTLEGRGSDEGILRNKLKETHRRHKEGLRKSSKSNGKHRRRNRNHNKFHKDLIVNQYNLLNSHGKYTPSEKKYFDYFPIEAAHNQPTPLNDNDVVVVLLLNDTNVSKTSASGVAQKKTRSRRDVQKLDPYAQSAHNYVRNFLATERGQNSPNGELLSRINRADHYPSQATLNDPWNNRFTQPLNNFYLPVSRPFAPSHLSNVKFPIPGIYYNAGSPSGNHPVLKPRPSSVGSRFGEDDDDRVIWEVKYVGSNNRPTANTIPAFIPNVPGAPRTTTRPPTTFRPTAPPGTRESAPPLIHTEKRGQSSNRPGRVQGGSAQPQTNSRPRTTRPGPTLRTTPAPGRGEPSKCVWGIVSCCSRNDLRVRYNCFEQIGCHGAFWDYNPCADNFQDGALEDADKFFNPDQ